MSRRREGLGDLLHWSRRPSTCDQVGARRDRDDRPNGSLHNGSYAGSPYGLGRPHTSLGLTDRGPLSSSVPGQGGQTLPSNRGGLPPLLRAGSGVGPPGGLGSGSAEPSPDNLSHFQESLYVNAQPHTSTSRLFRLGAGNANPTSFHRRSAVVSPASATIPSLASSPQSRTQSPACASGAHLPGVAGSTDDGNGGVLLPLAGPAGDVMAARQQLLTPLLGGIPTSTGWTGTGAPSLLGTGSPPRLHRLGPREESALIEEARQKSQKAAEILYSTDQDVTPADREKAALALKHLEVILGPREVALTKLAQEAHSLRAELGRELHASDKQASFARAQLKALERQHERLRKQLRSRPEPVTPTAGTASGSPPGQPGASSLTESAASAAPTSPGFVSASSAAPSGGLTAVPQLDPIHLLRTRSGSLSAPQSPLGGRGPPVPLPSAGLRAGSPLHPRPRTPNAQPPMSSPTGNASDADAAVELTSLSGPPPAGPGSETSGVLLLQESPSFSGGRFAGQGPECGSPGGGGSLTGSALLPPSERWNLAEAMERTIQMRALSRAEAAMAAMAEAHQAEARPQSGGAGEEAAAAVDVEELRRLKYTPGVPDAVADQPSYIGVNVRRAPSPLPGSEAVAGLMTSGGGSGGSGGVDPKSTLQWSNRGISTSKMPLLREVLSQTPQLVRMCLAGNKLSNEDVMELLVILSEPGAPRVHDIFLDQNTNLTWRCALPLALALGMNPDMAGAAAAADWAAVASVMPPATTPASILAPGAVPSAHDKIRRLDLRIISLCGVKLGDKGVAQLAEGLRVNNTLRELDLRRCGISDAGGAVLMDVLESNGMLRKLDASWNALRSETARALEVALAGNAGLREISLAHNGFGDADGARVVKGLLSHGKWLRVDLSHNTLGPGSCLMVGELVRRLGAVACSLLPQGSYAESWTAGPGMCGSTTGTGCGDGPPTSGSGGGFTLPPVSPMGRSPVPDPLRRFNGADGSPPLSPSAVRIAAGQLGAQLADGQPHIALDGNPLGSTGLRIVLDALEATSQGLMAAAGLRLPDPGTQLEPPDFSPPLPLYVSITSCNVAPPSDRSSGLDGGDDANPFLPSIAVLCRPAGAQEAKPGAKPPGGQSGKAGAGKAAGAKQGAGKAGAGKAGGDKDSSGSKKQQSKQQAGSGKGAAKGGSSGGGTKGPAVVAAHAALTLSSPHLDLHSPAGVYCLDLSHPSTSVLVAYLLRMREQLAAAAESGRVAAGSVALSISGIAVNGRPVKLAQLAAVEAWTQGTLTLTVKAPAVLAIDPPTPLTPPVAYWLAGLLADATVSPLWKLSVVQAAGSLCIFAPWQCLALLAGFDRDTQSTECVAAAQMLYARSAQPLVFWEHVLPRLTTGQQHALRERIADLVALDMNRPMGRYTLNLSRQVDRFVALRLQLASALESSWVENKYFINWLNASFNGQPLDRPGLTRIRDYTLPGAGVLRLDYVSYQKPGLGMDPAAPEEMAELLERLRGCTIAHMAALLQLRTLLLPPPPTPSPAEAPPDRLRSPIGRRRASAHRPPPPPKPRLSALQLTHMSVWEVAQALSTPGPLWTPTSPQRSPSPNPSPSPTRGGPQAPTQPVRWATACGFNPEPLFRLTAVHPPEWGPEVGREPQHHQQQPDVAGPPDGPLMRAVSMGGKSVKSVGGRSTASRKSVRRASREGHEGDTAQAQLSKADWYAALLLLVHQAQDLPLLAAKMSIPHLAAAVQALLRQQEGMRVVAALLAALPPLAASKFLYDQADPSPCLLPPEVRRALLAALPPERMKLVELAARGASEAAAQRTRSVRQVLNVWAAQRFVSADQVGRLLSSLQSEGDRVTAVVVLWPRLVDGGWKTTYLQLKISEQRQLMMRLGYLHVYLCLGDPHGISFALDLGEPEQRDIARELVRLAVKETQKAKQEARARGGSYSPTLLDLHGNGNPVSIPEDEKLWGMADSNFKTMDFLYTPSFEQSVRQVESSAVCIQRNWRAYLVRKAERQALIEQGVLPIARPAQAGTSKS